MELRVNHIITARAVIIQVKVINMVMADIILLQDIRAMDTITATAAIIQVTDTITATAVIIRVTVIIMVMAPTIQVMGITTDMALISQVQDKNACFNLGSFQGKKSA